MSKYPLMFLRIVIRLANFAVLGYSAMALFEYLRFGQYMYSRNIVQMWLAPYGPYSTFMYICLLLFAVGLLHVDLSKPIREFRSKMNWKIGTFITFLLMIMGLVQTEFFHAYYYDEYNNLKLLSYSEMMLRLINLLNMMLIPMALYPLGKFLVSFFSSSNEDTSVHEEKAKNEDLDEVRQNLSTQDRDTLDPIWEAYQEDNEMENQN